MLRPVARRSFLGQKNRQFFWLCFIARLAFPVSQWHSRGLLSITAAGPHRIYTDFSIKRLHLIFSYGFFVEIWLIDKYDIITPPPVKHLCIYIGQNHLQNATDLKVHNETQQNVLQMQLSTKTPCSVFSAMCRFCDCGLHELKNTGNFHPKAPGVFQFLRATLYAPRRNSSDCGISADVLCFQAL